MLLSCVLILPAGLRDAGNALGDAMGWGPDNYSVALSPSGDAPATHYGLHAWVAQAFLDTLDAGVLPDGLDFPQADFDAVMAELVVSVRNVMDGHFDGVCADQGLALVAEGEV